VIVEPGSGLLHGVAVLDSIDRDCHCTSLSGGGNLGLVLIKATKPFGLTSARPLTAAAGSKTQQQTPVSAAA
jgi:hypothetical protein